MTCGCCWVLRHFYTSSVISVSCNIDHEKADKFCSEALISAWGSFICRKSTTRNPRLYFPSEGSHTQDFYALKNPWTPAEIEPANLGSRGEYDNHWTIGFDDLRLTIPSVVHSLLLYYWNINLFRTYMFCFELSRRQSVQQLNFATRTLCILYLCYLC